MCTCNYIKHAYQVALRGNNNQSRATHNTRKRACIDDIIVIYNAMNPIYTEL